MEQFEQRLFRLLSSKSGFYIKEYYSNSNQMNKWIAILEKEDFIYAVVIAYENNADDIYVEVREYFAKNYIKRVGINVVITTENSSCDINKFSEYSKLVYSLRDKVIVYSHEGCKPLVSFIGYMNKEKISKKELLKKNSVTYTLMAINIIIFLISAWITVMVTGYGDLYNIDSGTLAYLGAKINYLIDDGQVWRLISSAFLHGGLVHLFFNMYALKIIGSEVEYAYGKLKYIIIYFSAALGGSIFSYIFNSEALSVGASGAIFGLFGAMLIFGYRHRERIGKDYMMSLLKVILINVVIGITMSNIDNAGHLGGLTLGVIISIALRDSTNKKERVSV